MFERLLYVSKAADGVTMRDAYDIIRVAHNRNSASDLTGGLSLVDGYFVQVLEGASYALSERYERYERIEADHRHTDIQLRLRAPISTLLFPDDWMALRDGSHIAAEIFSDFDYVAGFPESIFESHAILSFLLASFGRAPVAR